MKALQEGAYITLFRDGLGVVSESNSDRNSIGFDLHAMKKFFTGIMVVEPVEGTSPKQSERRKKSTSAGFTAGPR